MKILFTIRSLTGGGAERVVSVLSGLLADVGEDVHIITYKTSERDYSISEKVQIHEMPQRLKLKILQIFVMESVFSCLSLGSHIFFRHLQFLQRCVKD